MEDVKELEKEIDEKIRIWEKNRQALFDMAGLIFALERKEIYNIATAALFYRVLDNLQDKEITISYKTKTLWDEYRKLNNSLYEEVKYYMEKDSKLSEMFMRVRSRNVDGYLRDSNRYLEYKGELRFFDRSHNLMQSLVKDKATNWIMEILISKIPLSTKISMVDDIIKVKGTSLYDLVNEYSKVYPDSLYPVIRCHNDSADSKKKCNQKIMDLFNTWKIYVSKDKKFRIIDEYPINNAEFLQVNGIIDFTKDITYIDAKGKEVAVAAEIYNKTKHIYQIEAFYNAESYKKLTDKIRENTDRFLIKSVTDYDEFELEDLIKLKNFEITDKNISEIITALSLKKNVSPVVIKGISKAIEKKAATPKEYRKALAYTKIINESLDPKQLSKKRIELTSRLSKLNDTLQETVPGKTKIKSIDFNNIRK